MYLMYIYTDVFAAAFLHASPYVPRISLLLAKNNICVYSLSSLLINIHFHITLRNEATGG